MRAEGIDTDMVTAPVAQSSSERSLKETLEEELRQAAANEKA